MLFALSPLARSREGKKKKKKKKKSSRVYFQYYSYCFKYVGLNDVESYFIIVYDL